MKSDTASSLRSSGVKDFVNRKWYEIVFVKSGIAMPMD